jgi:phage-related protein
MNWKVDFYNDAVMESINKWPPKIYAKFINIVDLIEEFGPVDVGMPHIKPFGQGLFEIRAKGKEGLGRAFFCIVKGKVVIVLNGFIKKSQKAPPNEVALAKKRLNEVINNG